MCLTFDLFEQRARVLAKSTASQIALDWDFEKQCCKRLDFGSPELLVARYIDDIRRECVFYLAKDPLDESAQARCGWTVAASSLCRGNFGRRAS